MLSGVEGVSVFVSDDSSAEMWMSEKRCFSFDATMSRISGREVLRERMFRFCNCLSSC